MARRKAPGEGVPRIVYRRFQRFLPVLFIFGVQQLRKGEPGCLGPGRPRDEVVEEAEEAPFCRNRPACLDAFNPARGSQRKGIGKAQACPGKTLKIKAQA